MSREVHVRFRESIRVRFPGATRLICMVQTVGDARQIERMLKERFARFEMELQPEKTRGISFGRYEEQNAERQQRRANTFDFLGFTHYCGRSRKGKYMVCRKTSGAKFRKKCKEMNAWLKAVRSMAPVKEWWPILAAKLRGHYQYYGVSGNMPSLRRYYAATLRLTRKWLARRSQRGKFWWKRFIEYLKHYPLPLPSIKHNFYTLSPAK